ncbi:Uncharacterised protein [Serratia fonticola]|nr:Uncharacterised protein [Serratia fonticola]
MVMFSLLIIVYISIAHEVARRKGNVLAGKKRRKKWPSFKRRCVNFLKIIIFLR